ncbi:MULTISPECIES: aminotransferase class I/II-fold pyridoxal phosphate-dependent enzyme [Paraburkholderia]|uniref:aminotransferase class I/II-fold pyridoxal phosphate-dependent enzyme n=1 Tax=Paraburkholderia TaxID=1822464 RepID=UPI0003690361|nr:MULTISPECIES: aminotransferase class I/II-fold pyridoxal phosphate-dependent enzyme [Paraburkholderia]MDH6153319.1 8-amino-7-oxononanoate synthase [Paraburkholderia sp. WSM4179]
MMIDFASGLYLGLRHPAREAGDYAALTTGHPAALAASPLMRPLAAQAAALQGAQAGLVGTSTLHLAIDAFERLGRSHALFADDALYPVMRWAAERMAGNGASVAWFGHGDAGSLARRLAEAPHSRPPAIVTDATVGDGALAPIGRYVSEARRHAGLVLIDQSQVLGLLGMRPGPRSPWGHGGGGVLRHLGLSAPASESVLLLASWAKAFGAPLATLCGPAPLIEQIARDGPTQVHCSPPNQASLLAALGALEINQRSGARLRRRLLDRLQRLRRGVRALAASVLPDLCAPDSVHPLQRLRLANRARTLALHAGLSECGMRTALLRQRANRYVLAVIVRADHEAADIDALLAAMAGLAPRLPGAARSAAGARLFKEIDHV